MYNKEIRGLAIYPLKEDAHWNFNLNHNWPVQSFKSFDNDVQQEALSKGEKEDKT